MEIQIKIIAAVAFVIDFCLSIACLVMGTLHLNECQNHAASFLTAIGGITLPLALIAIAFIIITWNKGVHLIILIPFASLVKLALSIYGSIAIFGKFETQIYTQLIHV